jgi:hypothetical protein
MTGGEDIGESTLFTVTHYADKYDGTIRLTYNNGKLRSVRICPGWCHRLFGTSDNKPTSPFFYLRATVVDAKNTGVHLRAPALRNSPIGLEPTNGGLWLSAADPNDVVEPLTLYFIKK